MEPLFLKPYFQEKIWGGTALRDDFGFDIPSYHTGECWAISAHPHGESIVENGECKGMKLSDVWQQHPELFGNSQEPKFPLLTKILDAADDLSVQVHPDDAYALKHEGEPGKTECWYVIDAKPGSKIVFGHNARNDAEFQEMVAKNQWDQLLNEVEVHKGDFFYVPSGTIHGIGKGIVILETQQSSDTTYRVYDYNRKDANGNLRELHLEEAFKVATIPNIKPENDIKEVRHHHSTVTTFVKSDYFDVYKWNVDGKLELKATAPYTLVTVLDGAGTLDDEGHTYELTKGMSFIIPEEIESWTLEGKFTAIASTPGLNNR